MNTRSSRPLVTSFTQPPKSLDTNAVCAAKFQCRLSGHVIVSTVGPEGPAKCSGLDVARYDADSLHGEFGERFKLHLLNGVLGENAKSDRVRKFRIGASTVAALRFLQEQQQKAREEMCGAEYKDHGLIFCQPDGSYFSPQLVSQTIVRRLKKAGIKGASLHTLRHTHASSLLSQGVPLPAVSGRLGHADTNITARIYSHAQPDDDARAADAWENSVRGPVQ